MEYTALEVLRNKALIPENSVFLPGHSGDLLGGSQFIKNFRTNIQPNEIASQILKTKYIYYPIPNKQKSVFIARVNNSLAIDEDSLGYSIMEDWDIKEKIAKFIFNASQVYTYFGYDARFFFWDRDLVEFFRTLPPEHKEYKILYDRCVKTNYFEKFNLNFEDEIIVSPKALDFQKIKELLKPWFPARVKQYFMRRNDWCCYKEMSTSMSKEIPVHKMKFLPYLSYSSILINWYLYKIEKLINNFQNF
jgi:asparagine synthase (glutamine-hydrolysing)